MLGLTIQYVKKWKWVISISELEKLVKECCKGKLNLSIKGFGAIDEGLRYCTLLRDDLDVSCSYANGVYDAQYKDDCGTVKCKQFYLCTKRYEYNE